MLLIVLVALLASACAAGSDSADVAADVESVPVELLSGEYETLSGNAIDLGSLEGQDVVLWFWAPW